MNEEQDRDRPRMDSGSLPATKVVFTGSPLMTDRAFHRSLTAISAAAAPASPPASRRQGGRRAGQPGPARPRFFRQDQNALANHRLATREIAAINACE